MTGINVTVVGAGIVGLSIAYFLEKEGAQVTLVDRDPEGDKASYGNAGAIAVTEVIPAAAPGIWWRIPRWLLDPLGPLSIRASHAIRLAPWLVRFARSSAPPEVARISRALAAINGRVYSDLMPMLAAVGMADALHQKGALSVYATRKGFQQDIAEWEDKRRLGIVAQEISGVEARDLEPALGQNVHRAVLTPQWSYVSDPRKIVEGLRRFLVERGVSIRAAEVLDLKRADANRISISLADGSSIATEYAVVAAGAWSGILATRMGEAVLLESERGYNTTLGKPGVNVSRQLIFPEGKFVATPLECGLRVGGAAEFGGLRAPANYDRSRALIRLALEFLPGLDTREGTVWSGHRPATPDSLPVIGPSTRSANVIYAFGHGHLGLTQAATTGRLVCDLIYQRAPVIDLAPYSARRF